MAGKNNKKKQAQFIKKQHESMKVMHSNWTTLWGEVTKIFMPNKDDIHTWRDSASKGQEKHNKLFDGSPEHANELLASALHSFLTNPASHWFGFTTGDREIDKIQRVKLYLQKFVRAVHVELNNSNFQSEIHEIYLDLGCLGTGVLRIDENEDENEDSILNFKARPINQCFIRENVDGRVHTLSTEDVMTVREAFRKYTEAAFGEEAARLGKDLDKEITIIHMIMPREDLPDGGAKSQFNKPFISLHVWGEKDILLREKGFDEFPYVVPRWTKKSGELFGRSPAMKALPDGRMLQSIKKTVIRGAQKMVDPPLQVPDDGLLGRPNTTPGGLTTYRAGTKDRIEPLLTGGRPDLGQAQIEDSRDQIKKHFFVDQFQLINKDRMTQDEVNIRDDDRLRILGPIVGRLHFEFLKPMIARIVRIMIAKGKVPKGMPPELKGLNLHVFYTSQLARALMLIESQNMDRFISSVVPVAQIDPSAWDLIDTDAYVRYRAETFGIAEEVLRAPDKVKEIRTARQDAMEKKAAAQANLDKSQAMKNTAPVVQAMQNAG